MSKIEMQVAGGNKRRYFADIIEDIKRFGRMITYKGAIDYEFESKPKIEIL